MVPAQQKYPKHFHVFNYAKKLKKAGVMAEVAELHAEAMEEVIEDIVTNSSYITTEDLKPFATKIDLERFATKEDLEEFATKEDLKLFATKEDLAQFATKKDLELFATKEDLNELKHYTITNFAEVRASIEKNTQEIAFLRKDFSKDLEITRKDLEIKIENVEKGFIQEMDNMRKDMTVQFAVNTNKLLLWNFTVAGSLLAVMARGFHWI